MTNNGWLCGTSGFRRRLRAAACGAAGLGIAVLLFQANLVRAQEIADVDNPLPLTSAERETLDRYGSLQTEETGRESILVGAAIGVGVDALWHVTASQLLSRSRWIRLHCVDCRPRDLPDLVQAFLRDLPGFAGTGAALGACAASGPASNRMCLSATGTLLDAAIQGGIGLVRRRSAGNFHIFDHIAGNGLMALLLDQAMPRGIVPFAGRSPLSQTGNGIAEVLGEGLVSAGSYAAADTLSHVLHREPVNIRNELVDGLVLAGIPSAGEHLTLVLTLGPRFRLSNAERQRILNYTRARTGLDNAVPLSRADLRLSPSYMGDDGLLASNREGAYALTYGSTVSMTQSGQSLPEPTFLATVAHEVTHVRQFEVLGVWRDLMIGVQDISRNGGGSAYGRSLEQVPLILSQPGLSR